MTFVRRLLALTMLSAALACSAEEPDHGDGVASASESLDPGELPDPPDSEWATEALDDERYVRATVETACASAVASGDAELMRQLQARVHYAHRTTADDLAGYGARLNEQDPAQAQAIARRIVTGLGRCPEVSR